MIVWLILAVTAALIIWKVVVKDVGYDLEIIRDGSVAVSVALSVIMLIMVFVGNTSCAGLVAELKTEYHMLSHQYNTGMYEHDVAVRDLVSDIQEYNSKISKGKAWAHEFWFGIFNPDFYDQLELIEIE